MSSCTVFTGRSLVTTSRLGADAMWATGTKSFTMSYGILLYSAPLIECVPTVPITSV